MDLSPTNRSVSYAWLLAIICVVTLFPFLGETLFNTRGEPREAVVALSMWQDGNWILPVNNGIDLAYKPPFFHWLVAICSVLTGGVTEFSSRMPSALAASVMVMAGYFFYRHKTTPLIALLMGALTLTNFEVHRAAVACRVDMVLACMMVLSLYLLHRWVQDGMRKVPIAAVLCLSGAFLSKGPVGAGLPCLAILVYALLKGERFGRTFARLLGVGLLSCVLPAVWYVAAYGQGGQKFLDLVYEENVLRLIGKMSYDSHVNPWYYNVVTIVAGFVPYTLLVVFSLFVLRYRKPQGKPAEWWERFKKWIREMDDAQLFSLVSFVVIFVFYCIPKSKRSVYLLPCYPFLAYFLALFIRWLRNNHAGVIRLFCYVLATLCVVLTLTFFAVCLDLIPTTIFSGSHAAQNVAMLTALHTTPLGFVEWIAVFMPLVGVVFYLWKQGLTQGMLAMVFSIYFALDGVYQPIVLNTKSDKPQAEIIEKLVPQGRIYSFREDYVEGNPMHPFTINFYLGDRVVPFDAFKPNEGYLIASDEAIDTFRQRYPQWTATEVIDFNHRSCDDRKMLHLYHFSKS